MNQAHHKLFSVENKVVVITGGTGVLGSMMAKALAQGGAKVVIVGRRIEAGNVLVEEIKKDGGTAIAVKADVLNRDELENLRKETVS
jgi:NADP-dependent 3-hydroxy acid dehydrogenase YdfG